mgnify:CR=1 FL=1
MAKSKTVLIFGLFLTSAFWVGAQDLVFKDDFEPLPPGTVLSDRDADGLPDVEERRIGTDPDVPDTDGDGFIDGSETAVGTDPLDPEDFPAVPDNPQNVAPEPDVSVTSNTREVTRFLYTGDDPIQTGVAPDTIDIKRAGLLRGRVLTRLGAPLPGVAISIRNRPELGSTLSRADGMFDLAVNGGSPLVIDYILDGYLPSQRTVDVGWQEYAQAPDVVLIALDRKMTPVLDGDVVAVEPGVDNRL